MLRSCLLLLACCLSSYTFAETALRDDGRKVQLNADGSWQFVSDDVFATSESGQRVVLKADGSWQLADTPEPVKRIAPVPNQLQAADGIASVDSIVIEKAVFERAGFSKNKVYRYQTLIKLSFHKALAKPELNISDIELTDSKGNDYPILNIKPSGKDQYTVVAKGAPDRWSRAKFFIISVNKSVADTLSDLSYQYDMRLADTINVEELSQ